MEAKIVEKLDTGLVEFSLPFDRGEEKIYFNPTDSDFFIRLQELPEKIGSIYEKMESDYNKEDAEKSIEAVKNANESMVNLFDITFGNLVSEKIFKYVSPTSIVKGKLFPLYILEFLIPKIEKEADKIATEARKSIETVTKKYMEKYKK